MSIIVTKNVYVWCGEEKCVGVLDGRDGCAETLGGRSACPIVLNRMLRDPVPTLRE